MGTKIGKLRDTAKGESRYTAVDLPGEKKAEGRTMAESGGGRKNERGKGREEGGNYREDARRSIKRSRGEWIALNQKEEKFREEGGGEIDLTFSLGLEKRWWRYHKWPS